MADEPQLFRDCLGQPERFVIATEIVTSRGLVTATSAQIKDNALRGTSAWANNFLDRDRNGKRRRLEQEEPETPP